MTDEAFEQVIRGIGHPVGEAEIAARALVGDERYDAVTAHNDALADIGLDQARRTADAITALATMRSGIGRAAVLAGAALVLAGAAVVIEVLR